MESSRVINTLTNEDESNVSYAIKRTEGHKIETEISFNPPNKKRILL